MINIEGINLDIKGNTKKEVLKEFAKLGYDLGKVSSERGLFKALLKREKEVTTGFGFGLAVPHAKTKYADQVAILFGRAKREIEWESLDGKPVNTFICLISPEKGADEHLKVLAKLSRKLIDNEFMKVLKEGTEDEIFENIKNALEA